MSYDEDKVREDILKAIKLLGDARLAVSAPGYENNPNIEQLHEIICEALDVAWEEYRDNQTEKPL